ncbi:MBL fold metallo-hydrolase [Terrihabitans soli]|uniref:MBL fold metallo-hydrolase n=1 Tax=Terrihabitans soli TaxID=708113 RepID=A0A6S6QGG9_9HYPH|nr:MBL fold metallo-hydrolase [Terrihabitans soli]BCJ90233.1 MBL fold metallo-hydrolase [Terrihabitans soli]
MPDTLRFDRSHPGPYGLSIPLSPLVRRVVANNSGPFTFTGTVTHLIGRGEVAVLDPGPDDGDHIAALLAATAGETITHILVTHTHRDHTDGVEALRAVTGAPILGCAPHESTASNPLEASVNTSYRPDRILHDGDIVQGRGWTLETVATPGHTVNHLAFALSEETSLFPGDHVMAWSTTVVAPPDGNMKDYKASLRRLLARDEDIYYPAHGPSLANAKAFVAALLAHRQAREEQILSALAPGGRTVEEIVIAVYPDIAPNLRGAAGLSALAHLEELKARGVVSVKPGAGDAVYLRV